MLVEVKGPQLSESVAEATLVSWHKKAGDYVARDQNLMDVETDKVILELPASKSGVLSKIIKGNGEKVTRNEVIAQIDTAAAAQAAAPGRAAPGSRWMNEVVTRRCSMAALTLPGTWSSVKRSACGNSSANTSRQRTPS